MSVSYQSLGGAAACPDDKLCCPALHVLSCACVEQVLECIVVRVSLQHFAVIVLLNCCVVNKYGMADLFACPECSKCVTKETGVKCVRSAIE